MTRDDDADIGCFTIPEFCDRMRMGRTTAYAEIRAGRLKVSKVGPKKTIVTRTQARAYQALLEAEAENAPEAA